MSKSKKSSSENDCRFYLKDDMFGQLTLRQVNFCNEYLKTSSIRQSALAAGYSEMYANDGARELLKIPKIKAYIENQQKLRQKELSIKTDDVVRLLWNLANGNQPTEELVFYPRATKDVCDPDSYYLANKVPIPVKKVIRRREGITPEIQHKCAMSVAKLLGLGKDANENDMTINVNLKDKNGNIIDNFKSNSK